MPTDYIPGKGLALLRRWKNLLAWLESHGFQASSLAVECREATHAGNGLFARCACSPGSLLFTVPPKLLMNKATLKRHYPGNTREVKELTAVQLISMHLFIWHPKANEESADPSFGPYISILPRNFDGHPLTWLVLSRFDKADDLQVLLLNRLPPSVLTALYRLHTRFSDDWCKVQTFLAKTSFMETTGQVSPTSFESLETVINFLWAWLNVNTRCIYYRLKREKTDPDNLTMCPILDFANHTPGRASMTPEPTHSDIRNAAPVNATGDGLKFTSGNLTIKENDEILITYGLHSNKTLFVEYGFVNFFSTNGPSPSGEIDVQDLVEKYIFTDLRLGEAVKTVLVTEGYWGDWTLHSTLDDAQPSWRLITALRLCHFVEHFGFANEDVIQTWRDVVTGKREQISVENEQSWRKSVALFCDILIQRAEKSIATNSNQNRDVTNWAHQMSNNIQSLWREELFVAKAVKRSLLRGDEF